MLKIFKQNGNYSVNKIYLIFIFFCTLLPGFGAIDNNPIRWISIGFVTILFLFYETFISQNKIKFKNSTIVILSGIYLFFNCLTSDNVNESLITLYKLIIIVSVFYACYLAIIKISDPFLFICIIFTGSLLLESIYTLIDFVTFKDSFTGISQNRNISSSSLVFKLIFLIYLIDHSKSFNKKLILKVLEIITLFSIILLQSRLGIFSVFVFYFNKIFKKKDVFSHANFLFIFFIL